MAKDKRENPWLVTIDLKEGKDIPERYPSETEAMDRAKQIVTAEYVVSQVERSNGKKKITLHPASQVVAVTISHDDE